jgi:hypothetical protein
LLGANAGVDDKDESGDALIWNRLQLVLARDVLRDQLGWELWRTEKTK